MRFLPFLLLMTLALISLASAATVYNDPEVFWTRAHVNNFLDPDNHQAVYVDRISNEQLRSYLQDSRIREQIRLPSLERKTIVQTQRSETPLVQYYKRYVTQKDLDYARNTFDRILNPLTGEWVNLAELSDLTLRNLLRYPAVRSQLGLDATKNKYLTHETSQELYKPLSYLVTPEHLQYIRQHHPKLYDPTLQRDVAVADLTNARIVHLLQDQNVRQTTGIDEAFPPRPVNYGPKWVPGKYERKFSVIPYYEETDWLYRNTQRIYDPVTHRNYRSDYYGDEKLYDQLYNQRVRYQPWGQPKYYD